MGDIASFGRWVKLRRIARYLSQDELGRLVGCAAITIRKIEADERRPSRELAKRLAQHLAISAADEAAFLAAARAERPVDLLPDPASSLMTPPLPAALPTPLTSLIGREHLVRRVCVCLRQRDTRLITLTGPGGVGKTRVALQAAALSAGSFDATAFVSLAPLGDAQLVVSAIAEALSIRETGTRPLVEMLVRHLRERRTLLLLDNFEHVAAAAPVVARLLTAAPQLTILVTSRSLLRLSGEQEVRVSPLEPAEAAALFVDRARASLVEPITAPDEAAIAVICRRLDGLPLAIELAAAQCRILSPPALLAELGRYGAADGAGLWLLTGGPADLPDRQQTLRAAIDWSYRLLTPSEQSLLAQLAVFAGGWTIPTLRAATLLDELPDGRQADVVGTTLQALSGLLDKSMIQRADTPDGEVRFTMLATVRAYALERLDVSPERAAVYARFGATFTEMAESATTHFHTDAQRVWLGRLAAERDNLRAALAWALAEEPLTALRLAYALKGYWFLTGQFSEGRAWLAQARAQRVAAPVELQANVLLASGLLAYQQAAFLEMEPLLKEALGLFRMLDDRAGCAETLLYQALVMVRRLDFARGRPLAEEALQLARALNEGNPIALAELILGHLSLLAGAPAQAEAHFQACMAQSRALDDAWFIGGSLLNLGRTARHQGRHLVARQQLEEGMAILRTVPVPWMVSECLRELGRSAYEEGDLAAALVRYRESLVVAYEIGNTADLPECLEWLSAALVAGREHGRACRLLGTAAALRDTFGMPRPATDAALHADALAALREVLGEQRFSELWAEGRGATIDAAVALALE